MNTINSETVPQFVSYVTQTLQQAGFEAYLVGGCVRDMILGKEPKDWDITTNARPEQIQEVFAKAGIKTMYENTFGTVTVINIPENREDRVVSRGTPNELASVQDYGEAREVQVTTYRSEGSYADARHPDTVTYETDLLKDLERRDFTINAIAYNPFALEHKGHFVDPYNGQSDITDKRITCVRNAQERFKEDALRMLRAIRFSTTLNFAVSPETLAAIGELHENIAHVSFERIRDELLKIVLSPAPAVGIELLQRTGLLQHIIPELEEGIGCDQKGAHIYDVYHHTLHAFQHAADKGFSLPVRLAALFHDIGKPRTRRYDKNRDKYTFFGHEVVGAKMAKAILERLRVPRETATLVVTLVRNHMFFSDTEQISLSAVRRIIKNVGVDNIWLLMEVRECDRVGMKKAEAPYRLRKYHAMIEEALRDPISVGQLAIDGKYLMSMELHPPAPNQTGGRAGMKPGPRMGWMLHALLEEVLENPALNTVEQLSERVKDLDELEDKDLKALGEKGKEKKEEAENLEVKQLHMKHGVKK